MNKSLEIDLSLIAAADGSRLRPGVRHEAVGTLRTKLGGRVRSEQNLSQQKRQRKMLDCDREAGVKGRYSVSTMVITQLLLPKRKTREEKDQISIGLLGLQG